MRWLGAAAVALALLGAPAGTAQEPQRAVYQLTVQPPQDGLTPGNTYGGLLTVQRLCPNGAAVLDEQDIPLSFSTPSWTFSVRAPEAVRVEAQSCALQQERTYTVPFDVVVGEDARRDTSAQFTVHLGSSAPAGPGLAASEPAQAGFAVHTEAPESIHPNVGTGAPNPPSSMLYADLLLLGVVAVLGLGLVAVVRRLLR